MKTLKRTTLKLNFEQYSPITFVIREEGKISESARVFSDNRIDKSKSITLKEALKTTILFSNSPKLYNTIISEIKFLESLLGDKLKGEYRILDFATRSTMNSRICVLKETLNF